MADMKVAMTLTLNDLASVKLERFTEVLKSIQEQIKPLNDQLKLISERSSAFGAALADNTAGLRSLSRAMGGASRSGGKLGGIFKGLEDQLAGFTAQMSSASVASDDLGAASLKAGAGLDAMGERAAVAKGEVDGLHGSMKGLMELYAGLKIGEGLKKSVELAADYQTQKLQLKQRNLPAGQYRAVLGQANQQTRQHAWLTKNDALETQNAALSELPGNTPYMQQMRGFLAPKLEYLARRAGTYGDKSSFFHRIQNGAGLVDAMQAQQNAHKAAWVIRDAGQVIAASNGKDTLQSMETSFRALSKILTVNMGQRGFRFFNAGNEEFKAAGGGGQGGNTRMATLLNSLVTAAGGIIGKGGAYVLEAAGLIKKSDIHKYGHSSTEALVRQGSLLHSNQLLHDPGKFIFGTLEQHFKSLVMKRWKAGEPGMVNPDTAAGLSQDTAMLATYYSKFKGGGQATASAMGMFSNPEIERSIKAKERQMKQVATNKQSSQGINATAAGQWKIFDSQLHNLGVNIGTTLLPALTEVLRVVNSLIRGFNGFVEAFPKATLFAALGAAILGVVEAIKGLSALLGIGKSLSAMFDMMSASALGADTKIAAGSAATAAEVEASNLRMASSFALTGRGMIATAGETVMGVGKTFMLGFAAFAAGWEIWGSIKNFQIAGHTLNEYAGVATMAIAQQFDAMFNYIENGFIRMGDWLDRLGAKADAAVGLKKWASEQSANAHAASAAIAANNRAFTFRSHVRNVVAMQDWSGQHESGDPSAPTGISPADILNQANMAALPNVPGGSLNPNGGQSPTDVKNVGAKAAKAHQAALDHLYALANKGAAKADALAKKMNASAAKLHLAFMAMTNPLGAKIAGVNLKYSGMAARMAAAGHPGAASDALAIGHHKVLQYQYQGAMKHLSALKGNLHAGLTGTAALVTAGSLTKMEAAQRTIQLQKQAAPAMIQAADAALKYAKALGDPKLVQSLELQKTKLQAMGQQLGYYSAKVKDAMQGAFTGLFENIMHGQKTWGQMFASFFASIGKGIENTLSKSISQSITNSIMGKKANQGIGSVIGGISHMFGGVFGGSSSVKSNPFAGAGILGASAFSGGGGSSVMSSIGGWVKGITSIAGMFGFATGADNIPNDMVAQIHKGEMIIPAAGAEAIRSGRASVGGMPGGNHLHLTVHAMDSQSVIGALHSVRQEAAQMFLNTASNLNLQGMA